MAKTPTVRYVKVVHDLVAGRYQRGAIVPADDLPQVDRLIETGAVVEAPDATEERSASAPETLDETLRGAQATLPNVPHTEVDPATLRARMGVPPETATPITAHTAVHQEDEAQPDKTEKR